MLSAAGFVGVQIHNNDDALYFIQYFHGFAYIISIDGSIGFGNKKRTTADDLSPTKQKYQKQLNLY